MPPRRKPTSTRQKKADQQLKRAIKRGEIPPPVPKKPGQNRKRKTGPTGHPIAGSDNAAAIESARKLQSAFVKVSQQYLEETKTIASNLALTRPVPDENARLHRFDHAGQDGLDTLTCPKRPKWRYDHTKKEVEKNEEGVFKKWLEQTDVAIEKWRSLPTPSGSPMPRSTSYFERNLEVWRQLWRVTEISQIILVLLDSRCPLVHYPPSLSFYLQDRKVILVLTKVDISGQARVAAWSEYLRSIYPNCRIVQVESYVEKGGTATQGHKLYEPHLPQHFRDRLVAQIKEVHAELLEPPERVKSNPDRLKHWVPPVKKEVNWEAVLSAKGDKVGLAVGGATVPRPKSPEDLEEEEEQREGDGIHHEPTHLTIGLIGQPNVGKSSLLNALFGARKVRASKTPGKTKHFQTLFWTHEVRLVDCPGLVMPNYVPMEMQVLSGILPISMVSAVPACIYHAANLLPLERIYNLDHPVSKLPPVEDKRTWRVDSKAASKDPAPISWTAMDILTAYADSRGWVTAKAGRPDVHRAGNAILRALAEGRIGWAFWPPDAALERIASNSSPEQGLWIPRGDVIEEEDHRDEEGSEPEESNNEDGEDGLRGATSAYDQEESEDDDDDSEEQDDDEGDGNVVKSTVGRFGALAIGSDGEESSGESS